MRRATGGREPRQPARVVSAYDPFADPGFVSAWRASSGLNTVIAGPPVEVDVLADVLGGGRAMTALSASQRPELVDSTNLKTQPALRFLGSANDKLRSTNRAIFRPWHDGSGVTMIVVYWIGAGDTACLWDSTSAGVTAVGATWFHDASLNRLIIRVGNGAAAIVNLTTANGSAPPGFIVGTFRYAEGRAGNEWDVRVNGVSLASGNTSAAPSSADAAFDPTFGAAAGSNFVNFDGDLAVAFMATSYRSDAAVEQVEAWATAQYV